MDKKKEFQKRILATFKIEAQENIGAISAYLIELENDPADSRKEELFEVLYRAAHSLKGAARAVGFSDIESLCHATEDLMSAIRDNEIDFNSQVFDVLFQTADLIEEVLNSTDGESGSDIDDRIRKQLEVISLTEAGVEVETSFMRKNEHSEKVKENIEPDQFPLSQEEEEHKEVEQSVSSEKAVKKKPQKIDKEISKNLTSDSIRVSTSKLDTLLMQAEEMLSVKLMANQRTNNLQKILTDLTYWNKKSAEIYALVNDLKHGGSSNSNAGRDIDKVAEFCDWSNNQLKSVEKELGDIINLANEENYSISSKIETLLEDVKELITIPFSTLLDGFPKMIRDISKDLGKDVKCTIVGDSIEIDRRILEQIRNPLIHILRNAIDYGIEEPEERIKKNKQEKGEITIRIEQLEGNKVEVVISDDGCGINLEKLRQAYIRNEEIDEHEALKIEDKELIKYIFRSGVTTSKIVTDLSGRGLGMAIAQEAIEQLGGTIGVESIQGKSTTFTINLPLSIVTYRGVIIEINNRNFIVPTQKVHSVNRIAVSEIETVGNKATFVLNKEVIPLINLSEVLELSTPQIANDFVQIIVFDVKSKKIGFTIDKVIGEQEVLVKKFNKQLSRVRNILGASVLGSGEVVPILNISDLYKSSETVGGSIRHESKSSDSEGQRSILIVEDSITSRTLLKNILETSGFDVTTAIDGIDGFTKLKEGSFDAVVTDVEMPRMNGFELTEKIRNDKEFADMPVVLVTSLSKREDREKGIDVGANAYIVKSDFEQNNLIEILNRFL